MSGGRAMPECLRQQVVVDEKEVHAFFDSRRESKTSAAAGGDRFARS